jgi:hypothetical protein
LPSHIYGEQKAGQTTQINIPEDITMVDEIILEKNLTIGCINVYLYYMRIREF